MDRNRTTASEFGLARDATVETIADRRIAPDEGASVALDAATTLMTTA